MSNKSKQIAHPRPSPYTKPSTYKPGKNSYGYEMQKSSREVQKDHYDNTTTTRHTQTYKGGEFLDRRSGNSGYREELRYKKTERVHDKAQGYTKEYETEVKFKETITYHKDRGHDDYYEYRSGSGSAICDNNDSYGSYDDYDDDYY